VKLFGPVVDGPAVALQELLAMLLAVLVKPQPSRRALALLLAQLRAERQDGRVEIECGVHASGDSRPGRLAASVSRHVSSARAATLALVDDFDRNADELLDRIELGAEPVLLAGGAVRTVRDVAEHGLAENERLLSGEEGKLDRYRALLDE
jgi:hypothetical protein